MRPIWRPVELDDGHLRSQGKIGDCEQWTVYTRTNSESYVRENGRDAWRTFEGLKKRFCFLWGCSDLKRPRRELLWYLPGHKDKKIWQQERDDNQLIFNFVSFVPWINKSSVKECIFIECVVLELPPLHLLAVEGISSRAHITGSWYLLGVPPSPGVKQSDISMRVWWLDSLSLISLFYFCTKNKEWFSSVQFSHSKWLVSASGCGNLRQSFSNKIKIYERCGAMLSRRDDQGTFWTILCWCLTILPRYFKDYVKVI